jgi:hypothetical protein
MESSRSSLVIVVTLLLLVLCSGCASQHVPAAMIPPGTNVAHTNGINTIPAGTSAVRSGTKHFAEAP